MAQRRTFSEEFKREALVCQLHRGEFTQEAHNVVLVGGAGTGNDSYRFKTHSTDTKQEAQASHPPRKVSCTPSGWLNFR